MTFNELMIAVAGLLVGAFVVGLWARWRTAAITSNARARGLDEGLLQGEAQGRRAVDVELATMRERMSNLQSEASRVAAELDSLEESHRAQQSELSTLRQKRAQLQVHADRVVPLEAQVAAGQEQVLRLNEALSGVQADLAAAGPQLVRLAEITAELEIHRAKLDKLQDEHAATRESLAERAKQVEILTSQVSDQLTALERAASQRDALQSEASRSAATVADLSARIEAEQTNVTEKLKLLQDAREQLSTQFLNVANQVLEDKSKRFTEQNQENLGAMLLPLQERIREFQQQVSTTYDAESKERLTLKNEIERLAKQSNQFSEDAVNLTQVLKGNNKIQGVWGEMVLENVLEASGLRKGEAYTVQQSYPNAEGQQQRPDVVIHLPERKHLVVDSKVSLAAYERLCSASDDAVRAIALKDHLRSLRTHIKELSERNYPGLPDLRTPDFVFLFIPIEPAFMLAVSEDHTLFDEAYTRHVMLVSPTTLLATLRTIANIWRHESQNRNVQAIAEQCGKLYDKFVGFVADLEQVGRHLGQTQRAYDDAQKKLSTGHGNLVNQISKVKKLGVRPSKSLPPLLEESAEATDEPTDQRAIANA